jgi:hypothetical protein
MPRYLSTPPRRGFVFFAGGREARYERPLAGDAHFIRPGHRRRFAASHPAPTGGKPLFVRLVLVAIPLLAVVLAGCRMTIASAPLPIGLIPVLLARELHRLGVVN